MSSNKGDNGNNKGFNAFGRNFLEKRKHMLVG